MPGTGAQFDAFEAAVGAGREACRPAPEEPGGFREVGEQAAAVQFVGRLGGDGCAGAAVVRGQYDVYPSRCLVDIEVGAAVCAGEDPASGPGVEA
ncbi:hypothetical protein ACIBCP_40635 [Streptomyces sp. NPDC051287]|uniref:hypothetical protein n=1 Tax=Streptomyces sp. NPDC051287 TaxID=3365648 RepID=UPI0037B541F8